MTDKLDLQLAAIKLLVLDVDGVLTDGKLLYGAKGEIGKTFNVKDGFGLRQVMQQGVAVAAISARPSPGAQIRLQELGLIHIFLGCKDKVSQIKKLQDSLAISKLATAVVGDDIPDLGMMAEAGLSIAVADASEKIQRYCDWTTKKRGGEGAVREVCDAILRAQEPGQ